MKLFGFIAVFCWVFPLWGMQARTISYTEIIHPTPALLKSFKKRSFEERVRLLQDLGAVNGDTATWLITDVPCTIGGTTTITLQMINKELSYAMQFFEADRQLICKGQWDANEAGLNELYGSPKVRGTVTLQLWDALWMLCGIRKGTLEDASEYADIKLRYVLPYVDGCSWFRKYGYCSTKIDNATYAAAVAALAGRPCPAIKALCDFEVQTIIQKALDLMQLSSDVTIGELVKKLYTYCRFDSTATNIHRSWLFSIYAAVLKNKSFDEITQRVYHIIKHPDLEKLNTTLSTQ